MCARAIEPAQLRLALEELGAIFVKLGQVLTQLNANPTNKPLQPNADTLSQSDLISFQ